MLLWWETTSTFHLVRYLHVSNVERIRPLSRFLPEGGAAWLSVLSGTTSSESTNDSEGQQRQCAGQLQVQDCLSNGTHMFSLFEHEDGSYITPTNTTQSSCSCLILQQPASSPGIKEFSTPGTPKCSLLHLISADAGHGSWRDLGFFLQFKSVGSKPIRGTAAAPPSSDLRNKGQRRWTTLKSETSNMAVVRHLNGPATRFQSPGAHMPCNEFLCVSFG